MFRFSSRRRKPKPSSNDHKTLSKDHKTLPNEHKTLPNDPESSSNDHERLPNDPESSSNHHQTLPNDHEETLLDEVSLQELLVQRAREREREDMITGGVRKYRPSASRAYLFVAVFLLCFFCFCFFLIPYHTAFPDFVFCFVLFCFVLIVVLFMFPFQSAEGDDLFFFFFFFKAFLSFPFYSSPFFFKFVSRFVHFVFVERNETGKQATGPAIYVYSLLYDTPAMLCS